MDDKLFSILVSVISSGIVAIITGIIGYIVNKNIQKDLELTKNENNRLLEELKADLNETNAEKNARRDYEYEARKKLYEKCEPLLFILNEFAGVALDRIISLAESAKEGKLSEDGWLSKEGYYMRTTIYFLLSPLVVVKLIQKQLTVVDLSLEPHINAQYTIAKNIYNLLTSDFEIAELEQKLTYDPIYSDKDKEEKRKNKPEIHCKQGVPKGWLDNALESMIVSKQNQEDRCMSLGEFEKAYCDENSELKKSFWIITETFLLFHPEKRPVLWRILVIQRIFLGNISKKGM